MRKIILIALAASAAWLTAASVDAQSQSQTMTAIIPGLELERVVMLMRHGIRPPTKATVTPEGIAAEPWPKWDVPYGHLTTHGAQAVTLLGQYDRAALSARGLLAAQGCPAAGEVVIWSDSDERTIKTGDAELQGLLPGCATTNDHLDEGKTDLLFSPLDEPGHLDPVKARAAIMTQIGSTDAVIKAHADEFSLLQRVLGCCAPKVCIAANKPDCKLTDIPADIVMVKDEGRPKATGALDFGPSAAQTLMLEYVDGKPMSEVGWGRVNRDEISTLMKLHAMKGYVLQRAFYIVQQGASPLAKRMLDALNGIASEDRANGSKLTVLVGHDTNIADMSGLLDFHWQVASYPADTPPPAGAVGFELLSNTAGKQFVRVFYRSQTMDQMRNLEPLDIAHPPSVEYIKVPGCSLGKDPTLCTLANFNKLVRSKISF